MWLYLLGFTIVVGAIYVAYKIGYNNGGKITTLKSVQDALYQEEIQRKAYHDKLSKIQKERVVINGSFIAAHDASRVLSGRNSNEVEVSKTQLSSTRRN